MTDTPTDDIVERLERIADVAEDACRAFESGIIREEGEWTLETYRLAISRLNSQQQDIERLSKLLGPDPDKADWCLCGAGMGNKGNHDSFCTAYYSPKHPQLIPPRDAKLGQPNDG